MKTLKIGVYGKSYDIYFTVGKYKSNNTLAIDASFTDEDGFEDYYGNVSKNLVNTRLLADNEFYADTNNNFLLIDEMLKKGLIKQTEEYATSGFCKYPLMRLTEKFKEYVKVNE